MAKPFVDGIGLAWHFLVVPFVFYFLIPAQCQNPYPNPYPVDPRDQNAGVVTFHLTSKSDCSDNLKNIFNQEAVVKGYDLRNIGSGPTSCTIKLTSSSVYPGVQLQVDIVAMDIEDCQTYVSIFDGQDISHKLGTYDCHSVQQLNRQSHTTSGDTVTIIMQRANPDSNKFDIEIRVKPFRGGIDPDYDKKNYFSFQKFEQEAIVGMIGGFYALVLIICISVVCYCNVRYQGLNKKWETHQLATMKTDTSLETRSQVSQLPWSVGMSGQRGPNSTYSHAFTETTKRGPGPRSEDGSSVYDLYPRSKQPHLQQNHPPPQYRRHEQKVSQNTSYSDGEDDPDDFKEKIITSRVKTSGARWRPKDRRPPSFEEATRDSSEERSSEEDEDDETESSSDNNSTRKTMTTSTEEEDSETGTETESEYSSNYDSSSRGAKARREKGRGKNKGKAKPKRRRQSSSDDASSQRTDPNPRSKKSHPPPQAAGVPYGGYPQVGGQFVPVIAAPGPQFQPVPMMHPNYPPPQYPVDSSYPPPPPTSSQHNVRPTDPPVYSYLVRRGYVPKDSLDGQKSSAGSVDSSLMGMGRPPQPKEEPDTPLQSGVEYMRR